MLAPVVCVTNPDGEALRARERLRLNFPEFIRRRGVAAIQFLDVNETCACYPPRNGWFERARFAFPPLFGIGKRPSSGGSGDRVRTLLP